MKHQQIATLKRNTSTSSAHSTSSSTMIIPSNYMRLSPPTPEQKKLLVKRDSIQRLSKSNSRFSSLARSVFKFVSIPNIINIPSTCKWLSLPSKLSITPSLGRRVTGTLFGNRHGHVSFAVQDSSRSVPVLLLQLAMSTSMLIKEMSSGLIRIALECEKLQKPVNSKLLNEPMWSMYCNGKKSGYALSRTCTELDLHVLRTVNSVSVGAGVIPMVEDGLKVGGSEGQLLYMRAKFERVVGSRDSEAFYMMNLDGNGGPELSIFLLRI